MKKINSESDILLGAAAGLIGTALIKGIQIYSRRKTPWLAPPIKQDPGEFMLQKAESQLPPRQAASISRALQRMTAQALGFGYGMTFGAAYAACPAEKKIWREGPVLGVLVWAVGYLGWLPAAHLMPPVWKQKPRQVLPTFASHVAFGLVTAGCCELFQSLRHRVA